MKKVIICTVLIVLAILIATYLSVSWLTVDISGYKGDGKITKLGSGYIAKGYKIEFDKLCKINNEYIGNYKIDGMPDLDNRYDLYLKIDHQYKHNTDISKYYGQVELIATDIKGINLLNISSNLSDWSMTSLDGYNMYLYYFRDNIVSEIKHKAKVEQPIFIEVIYKPFDKSILIHNMPISLVLISGGSK